MKKQSDNWRQWPAERLSIRLFYALVAVIVVVFALFWLVGFDRPFDNDPNFNAPLLADAVLVLMELLLLGAVGFTAWSVAHVLRVRGKADRLDNNIPTKRIGYGIIAGVAVLMVVGFLAGSSAEMTVNGLRYADTFWLKASDMFIFTSLVLMVAAVGAVAYGATKYVRRK